MEHPAGRWVCGATAVLKVLDGRDNRPLTEIASKEMLVFITRVGAAD